MKVTSGLTQEPSLASILSLDLEKVYAASRHEQNVSEAPASINIISGEEIEKYGYKTLAEVLNSVKGFYASNDRTYDYIGTRGFSRPGDYNTRLLLLVDGTPIEDPIFSTAPIGTDFPIDLDLIQRVEIIRGPSASLYGTNAFFGVINIITKDADQFQKAQASGTAGSFNSYGLRGTVGKIFESDAALLITGTVLDKTGPNWSYPEFASEQNPSGTSRGSDFTHGLNLLAKFSYSDLKLQVLYMRREKGLVTAPWGIVYNNPDNHYLDDLGNAALKYSHSFPFDLDFSGELFYNQYAFAGQYIYDYSDSADLSYLVPNKDEAAGKQAGLSFRVNRPVGDFLFFTTGIEYRNMFQQDQTNFNDDAGAITVFLHDQRESWYLAGFIQSEFQRQFAFGNIILNGGIRTDYYETFGQSTNPRLALIYSPLEHTHFKVLYGTAFRSPNVYELYFNDMGAFGQANPEAATKSNPQLNPEKIQTGEIVLEQYLGKSIRVSGNVFQYDISGLINQITDPSDSLVQFINNGRVMAKGVEAEIEGKTPNGFHGRLSQSLQVAEDEATGSRLSNSPYHLTKANLSLPLFENKSVLSLDANFISNRKAGQNSGILSDPFTVTNATLLVKNLSSRTYLSGIKIFFSVYNLLDEVYADPSSEEHTQALIKQEGRNYRLKLTYGF